jgi:predicted O-methyltransferase YrrM
MIRTTSSYSDNNFRQDFKNIVEKIKPKLVVEFGIGNGYSTKAFADFCSKDCLIYSYDLFDDFPYNHADYEICLSLFTKQDNLKIDKANFYTHFDKFDDNIIDILHIDIANDGDAYLFAIEKYMQKISPNGVIILEGGSMERDNVYWMREFNKKRINPLLIRFAKDYKVELIDKFPSLTIISKNNNN